MSNIVLRNTHDIFNLSAGAIVSRKNLSDLISQSKKSESLFWSGIGYIIGNTPQQGINWIGSPPDLKGVIIKHVVGAYEQDSISKINSMDLTYAFKKNLGHINKNEKANLSLINQPDYGYPIFLFSSHNKKVWVFHGLYKVHKIANEYVILRNQALCETVE